VGPYSQQSKLAAYRSISAQGVVAGGDPHSLVLTVIDAVMGRLTSARTCIEQGDTVRKASLLHSSVILIAELRGSLDMQKGGALARNLSELYEYAARRIIHANLNSDAGALTEVLSLLGEVRAAWAAIGPQVRQPAPQAVSAA
jgi:flagellar secretion chaperone FliS